MGICENGMFESSEVDIFMAPIYMSRAMRCNRMKRNWGRRIEMHRNALNSPRCVRPMAGFLPGR
jgi:hypothetical protein